MKKFIWILGFVVTSVLAINTTVIIKYTVSNYDKTIAKIYDAPTTHSKDLNTRVMAVSKSFMGKPYLLGALGEGAKGKFDQEPLYRTDSFDCQTFVSTVLALVESNNLSQFKRNIKRVRYQNGTIGFFQRNHFASVDWNKNNAGNGYVSDITYKFVNKEGMPVAQIAATVINKPLWYQKLTTKRVKLLKPITKNQQQKLLQQLQQLSTKAQQEKSVILYIPLKKLFFDGKPNMYLFKQIPVGSIIEIVRPNWNLCKEIGTHLNVSHMGFVLRTKQGLILREASSIQHKVVDVPLIDYLHGYINSETVNGINVQKVILK